MGSTSYGTVIWSKLQGFQEWPSRYANPNEISTKVRQLKSDDKDVLVYFFGSHNYAWLKPEKILPFEKHFEELSVNKKRKKQFDYALGEALKWRDNPKKQMLSYEEKEGKSDNEEEEKEEETKQIKSKRAATKKKDTKKEDKTEVEDEYIPIPKPVPSNTPEYMARKRKRQALMRRLGLAAPLEDFVAVKIVEPTGKKEKEARAKRNEERNVKRGK